MKDKVLQTGQKQLVVQMKTNFVTDVGNLVSICVHSGCLPGQSIS